MDSTNVQPEPAVSEVEETIPTADLLALVREFPGREDWCSSAEAELRGLGITFRPWTSGGCTCGLCTGAKPGEEVAAERFTPVPGSPTSVTKKAVTEMIRTVRREYPGRARDLILAAGKKWGLDVAPAYRVRVTVLLDAEELEEQGTGWVAGEKGEPTDLKDEALARAVRYAIADLPDDRLTVRVAR